MIANEIKSDAYRCVNCVLSHPRVNEIHGCRLNIVNYIGTTVQVSCMDHEIKPVDRCVDSAYKYFAETDREHFSEVLGTRGQSVG